MPFSLEEVRLILFSRTTAPRWPYARTPVFHCGLSMEALAFCQRYPADRK
jgi:hypothetical protein